MRLIDADKTKATAREDCKDCIMNSSVYCKRECFVNRVCDYIDAQPTAEERPHGVWLLCPDEYFSECSICGVLWLNEECNNYCPNCGADMRGINNGKK